MKEEASVKIIVNADDLGLTSQVNRGIIECHTRGIVSSASLAVNASATEDAVNSVRQLPDLGVGIHLTLTLGKSVLPRQKVPSLVTESGHFYPLYPFLLRLLTGRISSEEIYAEVNAQVRKFLSFGIPCTHVDMHRHLHVFPHIIAPVLQMAHNNGLSRIRLPKEEGGIKSGSGSWGAVFTSQFIKALLLRGLSRRAERIFGSYEMHYPDTFCGIEMMADQCDADRFLNIILNCKPGVNEIMCHPAYPEETFCDLDGYDTVKRYNELKLLVDPELRGLIEASKIQLVTYSAVN